MNDRGSRKLAFCGISVALIIICLYGGAMIRSNKIFFVAFAIIIGCIPFIVADIKYGISTYIATGCLAVILVPNILYVGVYVIFGIYPLIKLIAEKSGFLSNYLIKFAWFNLSLLLSYLVFHNYMYINAFFYTKIGIIILLAVVQILFLVFDYFFTLCISYFINKILKGVN